MQVEIKLIKNIKLKFNLSSIRYQVKNNILSCRSGKSLKLDSDFITLDTYVVPTEYTKYIEVYTDEGKLVVIDNQFPTKLHGKFKIKIKKKKLDLAMTEFFADAFVPEIILEEETRLENLHVSSNSVKLTQDLRKKLLSGQNFVQFGTQLKFNPLHSKRIEVDIQVLSVLVAILEKNALKQTKYIILEITKAHKSLFLGVNSDYIISLLEKIKEKLDVYIYTDLSVMEFEIFKHYEQISTAVIYNDVELMKEYKKLATQSIKIDANTIADYQLEYTLNDLSTRKITPSYNEGITIVVENFTQLMQAIVENLNYCLCQSLFLNLETKFEISKEQQNLISSFGCHNIIVNSCNVYEYKALENNLNVLLVTNYPKYPNVDDPAITACLEKTGSKQKAIFIIDECETSVSVIDGYLVLKMQNQYLSSILNCFKEIEVVGFNNELMELLYAINVTINYNILNLQELKNRRLEIFKRQMWKIIGMPNLKFQFYNNQDCDFFLQEINVKQISLKYSVLEQPHEFRGIDYFELNGQKQPIVVRQVSPAIKFIEDSACFINYHNDDLTNTIDISLGDTVIQVTNKALIHVPAGTMLDSKGKKISIAITGYPYSPYTLKKYRNEWVANSSQNGEYVDFPNFYLSDYYTNYSGVYISPTEKGQMYATNITRSNKEQIQHLYSKLLKSDKLIFILVDDNLAVTNIITTYNVISNLNLSVLASQEEIYHTIKSKKLWKYVEVVQ